METKTDLQEDVVSVEDSDWYIKASKKALYRLIAEGKIPQYTPHDDLLQEARLKLIRVIKNKAEKGEYINRGYAFVVLRNAMLNLLRSEDPLSARGREKANEIEAAEKYLTQHLDREPKRSEVADKLGISPFELFKIEAEISTKSTMSKYDEFISKDADPESALQKERDCKLLREAIRNSLNDYQFEILFLILTGEKYEEVAKITGLPIGTVKSREHRSLKKILKKLNTNNLEMSF